MLYEVITDSTQWHTLKKSMASWRFRQKATEQPKRVQLSPEAWRIISTLAEIDKKSISAFIIDRFEDEYKRNSIVED